VIAACLLWLCAMTLGLPLSAQTYGPTRPQMTSQGPAQPDDGVAQKRLLN
jgi:hypothetical protein